MGQVDRPIVFTGGAPASGNTDKWHQAIQSPAVRQGIFYLPPLRRLHGDFVLNELSTLLVVPQLQCVNLAKRAKNGEICRAAINIDRVSQVARRACATNFMAVIGRPSSHHHAGFERRAFNRILKIVN
jgi:hypothetical protein